MNTDMMAVLISLAKQQASQGDLTCKHRMIYTWDEDTWEETRPVLVVFL